MRSAIRMILVRAVLPMLDSAILWAFGWRKEWVEGMGCGPHYVDPLKPDHLHLRDEAVRIAEGRARWSRRGEQR